MRKARVKYPGAIYHIYNQGVNRVDIFIDQEDNEFWLSQLHKTTCEYGTNVFCFVTMKNHYHCLLETQLPNITEVMWTVGFNFSLYMRKKYKRVGPLCRNRFQSQVITTLSYLKNVVHYIHNNPLEAGLIQSIDEITPTVLTSYHDWTGKTNDYPWLAKIKLCSLLGINEIKDLPDSIWQPIKKATFSELTRIEIISQRIIGEPQTTLSNNPI